MEKGAAAQGLFLRVSLWKGLSREASHRKCSCKGLGGQRHFKGSETGHRTCKAAGGAQQARPSQQGSEGQLLGLHVPETYKRKFYLLLQA